MKLPDDGNHYELIKGELLTMSPTGAKHGVVGMNLSAALHAYVKTKKLGLVFEAETGFILQRNPDTVLAPDGSFIRSERISTLPDGYLEMAPDLVHRVGHHGQLVLSGIPASVDADVDRVYRHLGMRRLRVKSRAGWVALVLQASW